MFFRILNLQKSLRQQHDQYVYFDLFISLFRTFTFPYWYHILAKPQKIIQISSSHCIKNLVLYIFP